jgi:hypothetical protein
MYSNEMQTMRFLTSYYNKGDSMKIALATIVALFATVAMAQHEPTGAAAPAPAAGAPTAGKMDPKMTAKTAKNAEDCKMITDEHEKAACVKAHPAKH